MTGKVLRHQGSPRIFLAYASEDRPRVREVYKQLRSDGYEPWLDTEALLGGQDWEKAIRDEVCNSDIFIAFWSRNALKKTGFVHKEFSLAIETAKQRPQGEIFQIPVKLDNCDLPEQWRHLEWVDLGGRRWRQQGYKRLVKSLGIIPEPKIAETGWDELERIVRDAALTAGTAAMTYYRNVLGESVAITKSANPSTMADQYATISLLQTLYTAERLASDLKCEYVVFAEELDDPVVGPRILDNLKDNPVFTRIRRSSDGFREGWLHKLALLVDAIDGTANFDAGLPFFGSAVAAFLKGRLCAGAVYDPFHHRVFYGSTHRVAGKGPPKACVWTINSGQIEQLERRNPAAKTKRCLIGTHLSRSNKNARDRFLRFLPHLYDDPGLECGLYMLNSGQMALAHVAWGNLDAFVNNTTKIWDVAAGEVLVRSMGGKVTDFHGKEIDYNASPDTSVLACGTPELHDRIRKIISKHYK